MTINSRIALCSAVSMVALLSVSAVHAQEVAEAPLDASDEAIVVTGSRLARDPNATAPLPISTLSAAELRASGNSDVTASLRQLPSLLLSRTVADSIERQGNNGDREGVAALNLRGLGAARTLVVIDGYRHVSGVAGAQIVDVSTIPLALIEQVEVLTGGASAIYGADAVTGVVNYKLRKDFEGVQIDAQSGISSQGDGQTWRIDGTIGRNFGGGRGNVTLSAGYANDAEVRLSDRDFTRDNARFNNNTTYADPARRFQRGDISTATTPNFAQRFSLDAGRFPYGFAIPTAAQFASFFPGRTPTAAEQALIDRAANAPSFALGAAPNFAISSAQGLVFRADGLDAPFPQFQTDINGNGLRDCDESYIGYAFSGCYVTTPGGGVRVFQDGTISTGTNQFGGDGAEQQLNGDSLIPSSERIYANLRANYEFSPAAEVFIDAKYTRNTTRSSDNYSSFYDGLLIFPENPFIPAVLQGEADDAGGLRISRDFTDLGANIRTTRRDTYRIVGGLRGEIASNLRYELAGNYGRTDVEVVNSRRTLYDRLFASIDVVDGPNGQPICRSDISNVAHPGSEYFPFIEGGFFTFRPGDGSCVPTNLFGGRNAVSQAAADFITAPTTDRFRLEQTVITGVLTGDTSDFFNLPGGGVQFALGAEYRKEKSLSTFSELERGLLPANSPAGPAGTFIGDITSNQQLIFDPSTRTQNAEGSFDVKEVFGEISLPILRDRAFFHDLTVGGAARYADYSTTGGALTWNVNGVWAPVQDLRLRGSYARAIRAPNISELFNPAQGSTFRPTDPCSQSILDQLVAGGSPVAQNRIANCRADGIPAGYEDPLTARFAGTNAGNPDLSEEKARTWTAGAVVQPRFIPGLTLSGDYYSIRIDNAIQTLAAQDIVNTCYDLATYPNEFCGLFTRNRTAGSATFLGLNFLTVQSLNFARLETSGVDFQLNYRFALGENNFNINVSGNWTEKLNRFFDPVDLTLVNPGLREFGVPRWSGVGSFTWNRKDFTLNYQLQYVGSQAAASAIEIERINEEFGPAGLAPEYWVHNIAANLDVAEQVTFSAGVNNLTDKKPYPSTTAYPVSGLGRFLFVGARLRY
ncbi:TonB-dependent receptor domain-containing protein [Polymorphobacter sp.]|uniref:TonB-dependent receptor domain-containing protein n=1 Tax=Polymorphobacter sp. TaxID=1909290 RepID=UPI003F728CCC